MGQRPKSAQPTKPGFKRGNAPFAESRGSASGRGWGRAPNRPQVDAAFRRPARGESKNSPVDCFWRGDALQERASPINSRFISFAAKIKFQLLKRQGKFLPAFLYTDNQFIRERPLLQGVPSFPTVHWTVGKFTLCGAPKGIVDLRSTLGRCPNPCQRRCLWTLPKGHCPFGNPVFVDLRSTWGAAPNPARGAASGLCKRGIVPFETRFCRFR